MSLKLKIICVAQEINYIISNCSKLRVLDNP